MTKLKIERTGGIGGFGGKNSHLQSKGEIEISELNEQDKQTVENLFKSQERPQENVVADGFIYKISRDTPTGVQSVETSEDKVPHFIKQSVKDELI